MPGGRRLLGVWIARVIDTTPIAGGGYAGEGGYGGVEARVGFELLRNRAGVGIGHICTHFRGVDSTFLSLLKHYLPLLGHYSPLLRQAHFWTQSRVALLPEYCCGRRSASHGELEFGRATILVGKPASARLPLPAHYAVHKAGSVLDADSLTETTRSLNHSLKVDPPWVACFGGVPPKGHHSRRPASHSGRGLARKIIRPSSDSATLRNGCDRSSLS